MGALKPEVSWLPPFHLSPRLLLEGEMEVTHGPGAPAPFSYLRPVADPLGFEPAGMPEGAAATAALRRLGSLDRWMEAVAQLRRWYLGALDRGAPPAAAHLADALREVPQGLRGLGNALPTAEAVALLRPLGRIAEIGAGFGLFARALERAGMAVAAGDADVSDRVGIAHPVRRGFDAAATLAFFRSDGAMPPLLLVWPPVAEGGWFAEVFAQARPGEMVAMASPEYEFSCAGAAGWPAARDLAARLAEEFEEAGQAPVLTAGWPAAPTPLRLWRRRG